MAGIRRAPRPLAAPKKAKPVMPLHQRILGKSAVEFDTVEDLRYKLERAWDTDNIEWDDYLACHDALDLREAKAREGLSKATGRYVKPEKLTKIKVERVPEHEPWKPWQKKVLFVVIVIILFKFMSFKP